MAEEKGTGSGSDWGALEIIIGVLLLIGLLDHISGRPPLGKVNESPKSETIQEDRNNTCGLQIDSPKPSSKVTGDFITLVGTAGECNWQILGDTILYAQVVDSRGRPVSEYTKISPAATSGERVTFATNIWFNATPAKGRGYLILIPARQNNQSYTVSARIPINF